MSLGLWVEGPLSVADALNRGECGGTYREACLIVSGALSAIAASAWPGRTGDRRRFVEAWVGHAGRLHPDARLISVPLLRTHLLRKRRLIEAEALDHARFGMFGAGNDCRVLTGDEVDMEEAEVLAVCPALDRKTIREHSYATVFYEHVRCGLVHEGDLGENATPFPMTMRAVGVSYGNWVGRPRTIHFSVPWLAELARSVAASVDAAVAAASPDPLPTPRSWWIYG